MRSGSPLILSLALIAAGCGTAPPPPAQAPSATVRFDFEQDLTAWTRLGGSGERAVPGDIATSERFARRGIRSVRFRVGPASRVARGTRAELTFDAGQREGDTGRYRWSMLIPETFPELPMEDANGAPNWNIVGQWHQQPEPGSLQSWNRFPGRGESPPVAFALYYLDRRDPAWAALRIDPRTATIAGFDPGWDRVTVLMLTCGTPPLPVAAVAVKKGVWIDIEAVIRWSRTESGSVEARVNGNPLTDAPVAGPNMWNKAPHYFKFGLYRNPEIQAEQVLYYDSFEFTPLPSAGGASVPLESGAADG